MTFKTPIASELSKLASKVAALEVQEQNGKDHDHETVYRYYYGKGALDYRDKLLAAIGDLPRTGSALQAYELVRDIFPDKFPGPSS